MMKWTYPSKSGNAPYEVVLADDGLLACNCKGYYIQRRDEQGQKKAKKCSHTDDVVKRFALLTEVRDLLVYVVDGEVKEPVLQFEDAQDYPDKHKQQHADGYVNPMLADAIKGAKTPDEIWKALERFQDGNWVGEIKYDGIRVVFSKRKGQVKAWSRPKPGEGDLGLPRRLPPHIVQTVLAFLPDGTFDGELISGDTGKSYDVARLDKENEKVLVIFDVLCVDGELYGNTDCKALPYRDRRQLLALIGTGITQLSPELWAVRIASTVAPTKEEVQRLWAAGAEGIIIKRLDSTYQPGRRGPDWVKIKAVFFESGIVIGYEKGENGPYSKVLLQADNGVKTSVKTKNNLWLDKFRQEPDKYLGRRLLFYHYGATPPTKKDPQGKFRGPVIWDRWLDE